MSRLLCCLVLAHELLCTSSVPKIFFQSYRFLCARQLAWVLLLPYIFGNWHCSVYFDNWIVATDTVQPHKLPFCSPSSNKIFSVSFLTLVKFNCSSSLHQILFLNVSDRDKKKVLEAEWYDWVKWLNCRTIQNFDFDYIIPCWNLFTRSYPLINCGVYVMCSSFFCMTKYAITNL